MSRKLSQKVSAFLALVAISVSLIGCGGQGGNTAQLEDTANTVSSVVEAAKLSASEKSDCTNYHMITWCANPANAETYRSEMASR